MAETTPIQAVDNPILCGPYDEPNDHWLYAESGEASHALRRRPASYWYKTQRTGSAQQSLPGMAQEQADDLPLVNQLREDVRRWRENKSDPYRGASNVTKELLKWWSSPKRDRRLFFCQREAVETIIYLAEIRLPGRTSKLRFDPKLSDENLAKLLTGERPTGLCLMESSSFFPTLVDQPLDQSLMALRRLGCKMATGSGKTVVMTMLISWAFCNRGANPASTEFPNAVLVCCPNLTVKERLQVLRPENPENYYTAFDLVPVNLRHHLSAGKVLVENWHSFAPESEHKEGDKSYAVVDKGPETPETIAKRVLGDLYDRLPIMVLNDEGHHCWRPAPAKDDAPEQIETPKKGRRLKPTGEEDHYEATEEEEAEAKVWLAGLDQLNNCLGPGKPGIAMCVDLSATPFFLQGSGYPEGQPFPWLVSDFGLVDAIESGIVKIPRIPVKDDAGKKDEVGRPDPKYFRLWHNIVGALPASKKNQSGKPKPEPCYEQAQGALVQLAGQWKQRFEQHQKSKPEEESIPPVLIVVCDNMDIADVFYRKISGETEADEVTQQDVEDVESGDEEEEPKGKKANKKQVVYGPGLMKEFENKSERKVTIKIDSRALDNANGPDASKSKQIAIDELRRIIATVGKKGQPGEHIRCVVSVAMLTEGWDANNVTQILGVRAFGSQLLCEQVVGRGLRRLDYLPDPETGRLRPEYVDVYGIPFTLIPFKGRAADEKAPEDKPQHRVWAVPARKDMEIRFPNVEGYVFQLSKGLLKCDVAAIDVMKIDAKFEPTTTYIQPTAGYMTTDGAVTSPFQFIQQNRNAYYENTHFQTILFQIAQKIVEDLLSPMQGKSDKRTRVLQLQSRHQVFPQVLRFVTDFATRRVEYSGQDKRELGLERYARKVVELITAAIRPDTSAGEPPLLPILNRYRPISSTSLVEFTTTRPVTPTTRSHVNLVVQHSTWEGAAAKRLDEAADLVKCYARNDHLGLAIPYEHEGVERDYQPDFLVRLKNDLNVVLEVKGFEHFDTGQIGAKNSAARKWVHAVNNLGEFGRWDFAICHDVKSLAQELERLVRV